MTVIPISHLQHIQIFSKNPTEGNLPFQKPSARDCIAVKKDIAVMKALQRKGVKDEDLLRILSEGRR